MSHRGARMWQAWLAAGGVCTRDTYSLTVFACSTNTARPHRKGRPLDPSAAAHQTAPTHAPRQGPSIVIHHPESVLDSMNDWCKEHHGKSGLTQRVRDSAVSLEEAEQQVARGASRGGKPGRLGGAVVRCPARGTEALPARRDTIYELHGVPTSFGRGPTPHHTHPLRRQVLAFVQEHTEFKAAQLAGNSVHVDRAFLGARMPALLEHLHYRIVDVSSFSEVARRWAPKVWRPLGGPRWALPSLARCGWHERAMQLAVAWRGAPHQRAQARCKHHPSSQPPRACPPHRPSWRAARRRRRRHALWHPPPTPSATRHPSPARPPHPQPTPARAQRAAQEGGAHRAVRHQGEPRGAAVLQGQALRARQVTGRGSCTRVTRVTPCPPPTNKGCLASLPPFLRLQCRKALLRATPVPRGPVPRGPVPCCVPLPRRCAQRTQACARPAP